jgi:hypothetical protein
MKKKLEAELISLAHRILQLKNRSDIAILHQEAQKLYEKLSVLRFVEENLGDVKPTIGHEEIEEKLDKAFDYNDKVVIGEVPSETKEQETPSAKDISSLVENLAAAKTVTDDTPAAAENEQEDAKPEEAGTAITPEATEEVPAEEAPTFEQGTSFEQPETVQEVKGGEIHEAIQDTEETQEPKTDEGFSWEHAVETELPPAETNTEAPENSSQEDIFTPSFELSFEPKETVKIPDTPAPQFTFDDLLGKDYADPVFVKPEEQVKKEEPVKPVFDAPLPEAEKPKEITETDIWSRRPFETQASADAERVQTLNDKLSKGITIGLNDRIAFMKNLFNNSSEDYNRVLSQLITFDTYSEAKNFIEQMIKPDYNNWEGKEEYEQRFMEIVEKRFS